MTRSMTKKKQRENYRQSAIAKVIDAQLLGETIFVSFRAQKPWVTKWIAMLILNGKAIYEWKSDLDINVERGFSLPYDRALEIIRNKEPYI